MHWTETLGAWKARWYEPSELTPYEDDFIRDQNRHLLRVLITVVLFVCVTAAIGVAVALQSAKQTRGIIVDQKRETLKAMKIARKAEQTIENLKSMWNNAANQAKEGKLEIEKKQKQIDSQSKNLEREKNQSTVRRLLNGYTQRKWVERRNQAAVLQVREAYGEMLRRFPQEEDRLSFNGEFLAAFNNALAPLRDAPGFSRTIKTPDMPVVFAAGSIPLMAYADPGAKCVRIRHLDKEQDGNCAFKIDMPVKEMRFSPSGKLLGVITADALVVFDLNDAKGGQSGMHQHPLSGSGAQISAFSFSQDERQLAYSVRNQIIVACAEDNWLHCGSFTLPEWYVGDPVVRLAIGAANDGKRHFAVGYKSGRVMLFGPAAIRVTAGEPPPAQDLDAWPMKIFKPPPRRDNLSRKEYRDIIALGFLDGETLRLVVVHEDTRQFLITGGPDVYKLEKLAIKPSVSVGRQRPTVSEMDNDRYSTAALSPDDKLYTVIEDQIIAWSLAGLKLPSREDDHVTVPTTLMKSGARYLRNLVAGRDWLIGQGYFYTWVWERSEIRTSKLIRARLPGEQRGIFGQLIYYPQAVAFDANGHIFTGTSQHGLVHWAQGETGAWTERLLDHCPKFGRKSVRALALSPRRDLLAVAMGQSYNGGPGQFMVLSVSDPDNPPLCDEKTHDDGLWAAAFSGTGSWLASGDWRGYVALWSVRDGPEIVHQGNFKVTVGERLDTEERAVRALAFHPLRNVLAAGTKAGEVVLYSVSADAGSKGNAKEIARLKFPSGRIGEIRELAFSGDGKWLAAAGSRGPIQIWEYLPAGEGTDASVKVPHPASLLPGHAGGTRTLAFQPQRGVLATGGADGLLCVWDMDRLDRSPAILDALDADVLSLAWDQEGTVLVASYKHPPVNQANKMNDESLHGSVLVWNLDLKEAARIACESVWRPLDSVEWNKWIKPISKRDYGPACSRSADALSQAGVFASSVPLQGP